MPGQMRGPGVPRSSQVSCIWCSSALPGSIGFFSSSSPKLHPTDHMSTAVVYASAPRRSSGARYQRVTTFVVQGFCSLRNSRDNPKSASFMTPLFVRSKLESLMSRWMTKAACKHSTARSSCSSRHLTSATLKGLSMRSSKAPTSCSQYSNTKKILPDCRPQATSLSSTMFGCLSFRRRRISRRELRGKPSFSEWIRTFFRATMSPLSVSRAR
mmetsp:Transcript_23937/g.38375  ORF Transcript_23937/g.38375 Transcript_23937/m.38375 type:complete len:213 (-) Transcript_23937:362-1000(-)